MRVALAGGGTGGHLFPGLAVAERLRGPGGAPVLFGSGREAERAWADGRATVVARRAPRLPGRRGAAPRFALELSREVLRTFRELGVRRPHLVIGLGGYASVAPGIAALLRGLPVLLLEQNAVPGKANRLLARLGGRVAASYEESLGYLPEKARRRARVLGNPLRASLEAGRRVPERFGLSPDAPILLVTGGSQGARGLNARILEAAGAIGERGGQVIHLAGPDDEAWARRAWAAAGVRSFVRAFTRDMGDVYRTADLVVSRAGGTTLAELAALGRPSVLVPFPAATDDHQTRNAEVFVRAGAARRVAEADLDPERFREAVADLLFDPERLAAMERAARSLAVPDAAERVAVWAREMVREARR